MARFVAFVHIILIVLNLASIPCVILWEPFYIWAPIITVLVSPVIGGSYCLFNRLENYFRVKAGMPKIYDRLYNLFFD